MMRTSNRKELMVVILIFIAALIIGSIVSRDQARVIYKHGKESPLNTADYCIRVDNNKLQVGISSWSEAIEVFPGGTTLGMSTVYSSDPDKYLLTFSKRNNILCKVDIFSSDIKTNRGITVGMKFEEVKQAYGDSFLQLSRQGQTEKFDVVYGTANDLVFNIRHNRVYRIVIQRDTK